MHTYTIERGFNEHHSEGNTLMDMLSSETLAEPKGGLEGWGGAEGEHKLWRRPADGAEQGLCLAKFAKYHKSNTQTLHFQLFIYLFIYLVIYS